MTGLLNRPNTWLLFLKKSFRYLFQLFLTLEVKVCVFVCARVREWEKSDELFGVGYYSFAV